MLAGSKRSCIKVAARGGWQDTHLIPCARVLRHLVGDIEGDGGGGYRRHRHRSGTSSRRHSSRRRHRSASHRPPESRRPKHSSRRRRHHPHYHHYRHCHEPRSSLDRQRHETARMFGMPPPQVLRDVNRIDPPGTPVPNVQRWIDATPTVEQREHRPRRRRRRTKTRQGSQEAAVVRPGVSGTAPVSIMPPSSERPAVSSRSPGRVSDDVGSPKGICHDDGSPGESSDDSSSRGIHDN